MMLFKPEHVHLILEGKKVQTRRKWKTQRAKIGTIHQAKTTLFSKPFAFLAITDVYQEKLKDMPIEDAPKEGYQTRYDFKLKWIEINGSWDAYETVWVVNFHLVSIGDTDKRGDKHV